MSAILSLLSIYFFILVGYFSKKFLRNKIDEKTLIVISVYILQPFLTFWGLLKRDIDLSLIATPAAFATITITVMIFLLIASKRLFSDPKERSIFIIASVVGNTGNLGIPLGIALFGEESVPFTTMINLANIFIVYTFGVYFYSRGNFSIKESIKNIFRLPILWFAILAIIFNVLHIEVLPQIEKMLLMGAYASIVIQLLIFGIYLYAVKIKEINIKLIISVNSVKFIFLPVFAYFVIFLLPIEPLAKAVLFMEIMMPIAVTNVNLAALYDSKPKEVTALVFITSILFLILIFAYFPLINSLLGRSAF
ncbi:AEC family transporter [Nitrosophilus alvini]|uniref:AEC family transporter n=1 Tax=Nitrosophilus alvini TaxID=2714855 RepID=UPI00190AF0ED|nr:AEC family transporter [Nitrosophilus alvini]